MAGQVSPWVSSDNGEIGFRFTVRRGNGVLGVQEPSARREAFKARPSQMTGRDMCGFLAFFPPTVLPATRPDRRRGESRRPSWLMIVYAQGPNGVSRQSAQAPREQGTSAVDIRSPRNTQTGQAATKSSLSRTRNSQAKPALGVQFLDGLAGVQNGVGSAGRIDQHLAWVNAQRIVDRAGHIRRRTGRRVAKPPNLSVEPTTWPRVTPAPANTSDAAGPQWSRPASLFTFGDRPNSPNISTIVSAKRPRVSISSSNAEKPWSISGSFLLRLSKIWRDGPSRRS